MAHFKQASEIKSVPIRNWPNLYDQKEYERIKAWGLFKY